MEGIEYEVLYDGSNYHTYKLANDILRKRIKKYDAIINNAKKILQESEDYVDEIEYRYIINSRQMDLEHKEIVAMLSESKENIDLEYKKLMKSDDSFADRVKRYVVGKVRARGKWKLTENKENFKSLTWLSPETVLRFSDMSLGDIAKYDCIGTLLIDLEYGDEDETENEIE